MGGRAGGGASGGMGSGSRGVVTARMKEIQNSGVEHAFIFDANGKEVFHNVGGMDEVSIDDALAKNRITLHNHPGDSTFSHGDIETAITTNQLEMKVVTQSGTVYSLRRPKKGWGISTPKQLSDAVNKVGTTVANNIAKSGKSVSMDEAFHMQWQALSKQMGWNYSKTKLK